MVRTWQLTCLPLPLLARANLFATLAWLGFPVLVFLLTHVRLLIGLPLAVLLIGAAAYACWRRRPEFAPDPAPGSPVPLGRLALLYLVLLAWVATSGIGGLAPQSLDWLKHMAVLHTLIERPWPAPVDAEGQPAIMAYYVAWYLPGALVGKVAGWDAAHLTLLLYSWIGVMIVANGFFLLVREASWRATLFLILFSGLDALALLLFPGYAYDRLNVMHLESWSHRWQYSAFTSLLIWVPQMGLAGWMATAAVLQLRADRTAVPLLGLLLVLLLLWSPLLVCGLAPFVVAVTLPGLRLREIVAWACQPVTWAAVLLGALLSAYYLSRLGLEVPTEVRIPIGWVYEVGQAHGRVALTAGAFAAYLIAFVILEIGLYAAFIVGSAHRLPGRHDDRLAPARHRGILVAALVLIVFTLSMQIGINNENAMRTSIPLLFVVAVLLFPVLTILWASRRWRPVVAVLIIIAALTPVTEFARQALTVQRGIGAFTATVQPFTLEELQRDYYGPGDTFLWQYVGSLDSFYGEWLAPRPETTAEE